MSLARTLWAANKDWADRILANRFVQGLGDGSLPVDSFQRYVAQDAYFLEAFARADRKSTRLNSSHVSESRMPSSA